MGGVSCEYRTMAVRPSLERLRHRSHISLWAKSRERQVPMAHMGHSLQHCDMGRDNCGILGLSTQFRDLQRYVRDPRRFDRLHGVDLTVNRHSHRWRRTQCRTRAPDQMRFDSGTAAADGKRGAAMADSLGELV
jgi:hypothetical protein